MEEIKKKRKKKKKQHEHQTPTDFISSSLPIQQKKKLDFQIP
jgi:hypothetical protein